MLKIEVKQTPAGWIVVDGVTMGPFAIRSRAIDLAEGMVQALRISGETVELVVEHERGRGARAGPDDVRTATS